MSAQCQKASSVPAWQRGYSLISWWQMEEFSAGSFYRIGSVLERLRKWKNQAPSESDDFPKDEKEYFGTMLRSVHYYCRRIGLRVTCRHIERLNAKLAGSSSVGPTELAVFNDLSEIDQLIRDEMEGHLFFFVPPDRAKFYARNQEDVDAEQSLANPNWPSVAEQRQELFGKGVESAFPSVISDFEEAGKCLALARATACVFHLMRVMERGLKLLSKGLDIPYAPSWESYLKQIETKISEKHAKKTKAWKQEEYFYRDVLGDLQIVKIAFRNPTMHVVKAYTLEEAEDVFRAVRAFMRRLSTKFTDKGPRKKSRAHEESHPV